MVAISSLFSLTPRIRGDTKINKPRIKSIADKGLRKNIGKLLRDINKDLRRLFSKRAQRAKAKTDEVSLVYCNFSGYLKSINGGIEKIGDGTVPLRIGNKRAISQKETLTKT